MVSALFTWHDLYLVEHECSLRYVEFYSYGNNYALYEYSMFFLSWIFRYNIFITRMITLNNDLREWNCVLCVSYRSINEIFVCIHYPKTFRYQKIRGFFFNFLCFHVLVVLLSCNCYTISNLIIKSTKSRLHHSIEIW